MRSAPSLRSYSKLCLWNNSNVGLVDDGPLRSFSQQQQQQQKIVKCVDLPLNDSECFLLSVCLSSPGDRQCDVPRFVLRPQVASQVSLLIRVFQIAFNPKAYNKHSAANFSSSCQIKIQISSTSSLVRVLPVCLLLSKKKVFRLMEMCTCFEVSSKRCHWNSVLLTETFRVFWERKSTYKFTFQNLWHTAPSLVVCTVSVGIKQHWRMLRDMPSDFVTKMPQIPGWLKRRLHDRPLQVSCLSADRLSTVLA